jgi:hypothetical protein
VVVAPQYGDEGVGHAEVRILADPDDGEELLIGAMYLARAVDVEVAAVVEVAIRGADESHRLGDLVDRIVVKGEST